MIDFSKVAVGDKVLIEATVDQLGQGYKYPLEVSYNCSSTWWPPRDAIVSHIPRRPEKGDKVFSKMREVYAEFICSDGDEAWVHVIGGVRCTWSLSEMTVTKRKSAE